MMKSGLHTTALWSLAAFALILAGCTKETIAQTSEADTVSGICVVLDAVSKASFDCDGSGKYADRCRLQIFSADTLYYDRTVDVKNFSAKFTDILLDRCRHYDYLFWADNREGNFYNTDNLHDVALRNSYLSSDDRRDAFYGAALNKTIDDMRDTTVILRRPFAQLNVITDDIPELYAQLPDKSQLLSIVPDSIHIWVSEIATHFDVSTGSADSFEPLVFSTSVYTTQWKTGTGDGNTLSMDYFFALPAENASVANLDFKLTNSTNGLLPVEYSLTSVPLRRNWRTNIRGNLLCVRAKIGVYVSPEWEYPEYDR